MQGHVTMSQSELGRLQILQRVIERRMTQAAAAHGGFRSNVGARETVL
jgi:hypothetical protein